MLIEIHVAHINGVCMYVTCKLCDYYRFQTLKIATWKRKMERKKKRKKVRERSEKNKSQSRRLVIGVWMRQGKSLTRRYAVCNVVSFFYAKSLGIREWDLWT